MVSGAQQSVMTSGTPMKLVPFANADGKYIPTHSCTHPPTHIPIMWLS